MDWTTVSAISTTLMAIVISATALFAIFQLVEIRKSRKVSAFMNIRQILQEESTRKARGTLINAPKNFKKWSKKVKEAAEKACHTYDSVGIMVSNNLIEKDLIVKEWRDSIILCWEAAEPWLIEYRKIRGKDFWDDFENLYKMAKSIPLPEE